MASNKMNLYKIDGGIGKNIIFSSIIKEIVQKEGKDICIETAYPEVFNGAPGIARVYSSAEGKDPHKFYKHFNKIFASDPYNGTFWKGNVHCADAWREQVGLEHKGDGQYKYPVVGITQNQEIDKMIAEKIGDFPYYIIQISGGQSPYDLQNDPNVQYTDNHMRRGRNMGSMDPLYNTLKKEFPDHKMVQFGLPNEPRLKDAIFFEIPYQFWNKIFYGADFFVGIDSMMSHVMAAFQKPGVVYWDMNSPAQFGWNYEGRFDFDTVLPGGITIDDTLARDSIGSLKKHLGKILVKDTTEPESIEAELVEPKNCKKC